MQTALVAVYVTATAVASTYAALSWRRRRRAPLASSLALITAGAALWSLAQAVAVGVDSAPVALTATYLMFPGVAMIVAGFLWHTTVFTGRRLEQLRRRRTLLWVHPVLLMTAVVTDPWHHLFFTSAAVHATEGVTVQFGPLYWVHTAYCYTMIGIGAVRSVAAMRRAVRGHRRVFVIFLAGGLAPLVGNLLTVFADHGDRQVDLTPILFLFTASMWWWAERSGMPARRMPVAYEHVIAAISDAVMVLDPDGRVLDVNPAAVGMLAEVGQVADGDVVGRMWFEVVGPQLTAAFAGGTDQQTLTAGDGTIYDVRVVRMRTSDGSTPGAVVVVRDVTELERLRAELTDQATRDGLTGVYNRRHFTSVLREQADRGRLAVVMLDVDHFKSINDTYGHAVGDQVLIRLARELTAVVGDTGTVARYGGEEFAVILPDAGAHAATELAERLRHCCDQVAVVTPRGPLRATFSAGVAELVPGSGIEDLLRRTDRALYAAKEQGRNRVVTDDALAMRR